MAGKIDVEQQLIVVVGLPTSAEFEFPALIRQVKVR